MSNIARGVKLHHIGDKNGLIGSSKHVEYQTRDQNGDQKDNEAGHVGVGDIVLEEADPRDHEVAGYGGHDGDKNPAGEGIQEVHYRKLAQLLPHSSL